MFKDMPSKVRPGGTLRLRLSLGARHATQSAEELEVSLDRLAGAIRVDATLEGPGVEPLILESTIASDAARRCVIVSLDIPSDCSGGTGVVISAVSVNGQAMPGLPLRIPVSLGIVAPFRLQMDIDIFVNPSISHEGRFYCPTGVSPAVLVFDADGSPMPGLPLAAFGLSERTAWSAYVNGASPALLLADESSRLVAVDPVTHAIRWTSAELEGSIDGCYGIATFPLLGVIVVCEAVSLRVYRLSDGIRVGSLNVPGLSWYLASDVATGTVFGCVKIAKSFEIHAWLLSWKGATIKIRPDGPVAAAGGSSESRVLAVVPPAPGNSVSHLVVGTTESCELRVLSLPDLTLVHTHILEGVVVSGLVADPLGSALAVCDHQSEAIHVLTWPLPGMLPLQ